MGLIVGVCEDTGSFLLLFIRREKHLPMRLSWESRDGGENRDRAGNLLEAKIMCKDSTSDKQK